MHSRSRAINEGLWHEGSEHPLSQRYLFNQGPGGHDVIGRVKSIDREGPHGNDSFFTSFAEQARDGNIAVEV